jgi:glutamate formiminotransferase
LYIGQAGASAIGARDILIAFNIYLDTTDLHYAKIIAKSIRESSGGLPYVKALGMLVNNKAQVSMNLMNYRKTSIQTVFTRVKELAEDYGIRLHHSELVGCLPLEAIDGIHTEDILLFDFSQDRILENHFSG